MTEVLIAGCLGILIFIWLTIRKMNDNMVKISHAHEQLWHRHLKIGKFKDD